MFVKQIQACLSLRMQPTAEIRQLREFRRNERGTFRNSGLPHIEDLVERWRTLRSSLKSKRNKGNVNNKKSSVWAILQLNTSVIVFVSAFSQLLQEKPLFFRFVKQQRTSVKIKDSTKLSKPQLARTLGLELF